MLETLLVGGAAGIITALVVSLLIFQLYRQYLKNTFIQYQGWEQAQEKRERAWELKQEERSATLKENLQASIQELRQEWHEWEQKDQVRVQALEQEEKSRIQALAQTYELVVAKTSLKHKLEHLPLVEDASLPSSTKNQSGEDALAQALPVQLAGEDLAGQNLSRRYLSHANLRGALLRDANFFMADLSYACLVGADLSGADLSGANLVGADLSNALLTNANMLVADVNQANFSGVDLSQVRNLVLPDVETPAVKDINELGQQDIAVTLPRVPSVTKSSTSSAALQESSDAETLLDSTYDIIRSQSLEALPEPEASTTAIHTNFMLSFPTMLPETPLPPSDETEEDQYPWSLLSNETLRILDEAHFSANEAVLHEADKFSTASPDEETRDVRRARAS